MESSTLDVELLVGPYRSGKTRTLIAELLAFKQSNPLRAALIIVPSARYGRLFKQILDEELLKTKTATMTGLFSVEIMPFYQVCIEELRKRRGALSVLPEEIRPALMSRVLSEMKRNGEINTLSIIAEFHGTASAILELIDEFQRSGLSADDLSMRLARSVCQESRYLELALVYRRYLQKLNELKCLDQKSLAMLCREALFADPRPDFGMLIIDGFDRVSHLQGQIFAGLAQCADIVRCAFDYILPPESENAATTQDPLAQSPEDYLWKEAGFRELVLNLKPRLKHMEARRSHAPSVVASSSLDRFCEMQELVRSIKSALLEEKVDPSEILVVVRAYDAYAGAIESAFQDAGIGFFIDGSAAVVELAPWQFIKQLLILGQGDFRRKALLDLLRSSYLNLDAMSMSARHVSFLDRESYDARFVGGLEPWIKYLAHEKFDQFSETLIAFMTALNFGDQLKSCEAHVRYIEDLIDRFMKFPASEHDLRSSRANAERETIKALRRSLKVMLTQAKVLQDPQDQLDQREPLESFEQFFSRFLSLMENSNYPRPRPQSNVITISSAELAANKRFSRIYLCGMVEGDFPRHQAPRGFLSPDETKRWLGFSVDIRNPRHEPGFERALFYSLLERASDKLILSIPQYEISSEELLPSFYLSELQEEIELPVNRLLPYENGLRKPYSSNDAICSVLWHSDFRQVDQMAIQYPVLNQRWIPIQNALQSVLARASKQTNNLFNGDLAEFFDLGALSLISPPTWTASKLNDYGKCPFRFWTSHILNLNPREEPEPGLTPALIGQTYHKILEIFFSALYKTARQNRGARVAELLDLAFEHGIKWLQQRTDFSPGPYFEHEKKELRFRIQRFVQRELQRLADDPDFFPAMFEVSFGRETSLYPALVLDDEFGRKISISGSIDRVDLPEKLEANAGEAAQLQSENEIMDARVIDYKTGSRSITIKEAEQGRNLQLPIYALAMRKAIMPGIRVNAASYLSISSARPVGRIDFESGEHAHISDRAEYLIKSYVSQIERGVFSIRPNGRDVCKQCQHVSACRIGELKSVMEDSDAEVY